MSTSFTPILQRILDRVPGAVGAIFADAEGEAVDQAYVDADRHDVLVIAAHFGVILHQVQGALRQLHAGAPREVVLRHEHVDVCICPVGEGYYLLLALRSGAQIGPVVRTVQAAADELRREM